MTVRRVGNGSRSVFLAELVLLAAPSVAVLVPTALVFGGYALFGFAVSAWTAVSGVPGGEAPADPVAAIAALLGLLAAAGGVAALAAGGLFGIGCFLRLALAYGRRGRDGLTGRARTFRRALAAGAPALVVMVILTAALASDEGAGTAELFLLFYLSGLPLLVPVAHLWRELGAAEDTGRLAP